MAPDSTTDDTKEIQQAGGNATSDDAAMGLDQPPSQVSLKDFPYSNDMETEKGNSEVLKKGVLPLSHHGGNSNETLMQERDKPVEIQSKGLADLPGAQLPGDSQTIDFESQSQKIDGKGLGDPNQEQDSVILKERSLAVKAQPQEEGVTGPEEMDINTGLTHVESSSVIEPTEGKLICEVNEIEEKCLSKEMPALELVTEDETKKMEVELCNEVEGEFVNPEQIVQPEADANTATNVFLPDKIAFLGNESETQENQVAFMKELEAFHKERFLEFKPPKFYGEPLNCLKSVFSFCILTFLFSPGTFCLLD